MSISRQFQASAKVDAAPSRREPTATAKPLLPSPEANLDEPTPRAKGGRPKKENAKELITLRLDPRVLAHYRASGDGWQSRLNADLVRLCGL
jgi:uncharacterized protein (DUF4415 family)